MMKLEIVGLAGCKMSTGRTVISRRTAIAGAAAATVAQSRNAAEAGRQDRIFPVLEAFRLAERILYEAIKAADLPPDRWLTPAYVRAQSKLSEAYTSFKKAQFELLTTTPTTRDGVAALLRRLGQPTHTERPKEDPSLLIEALIWYDEPTREAARNVLNRLAALELTIS